MNSQTRGGLSKNELRVLKAAFNVCDGDHDGTITRSDLKAIMKKLGYKNVSNADLQQMIQNVNGKNAIDFESFLSVMQKDENTNQDRELREAFKVLDTNKSGTLSHEELFRGLTRMGVDVSAQEIDEIMKKAGTGGSKGEITFESFKRLMGDDV